MSTTINEPKEITLIDGKKITVRPLKISLLRSFMKEFDTLGEVATDNDKSMDVMINCIQIAMQQYDAELAADKAKMEEVLDLPTVYAIIEAASGIKLGDASLLGIN